MIAKSTIDLIKSTARIEEVVGDFINLKKSGSSWLGICPFHDDKTPSLHVTPRLDIYKCFVCDSVGDSISFVMNYQKISYVEALRYLAKKYGIPIEEDHALTDEEKAAQTEKESLAIVNSFAENFFINQMMNTEAGKAIGLSYFKERGFKDTTIQHFKLGYCPEGWDTFTQEALKQGFNLDFLLKTGLTKKSEKGKLFDFFRGRVIFPIHDNIGKTVGFGGRILKKDDKTAKYFNSPESELYHKGSILYGFYFARKAIRNKDNVYLVEGYTDVISLYEAGIDNVVASSGTALTEGQIKLLASQTRNITVLYDGDIAGIKASLRGITLLLQKNLNVQVILLPDGDDPDSFSKKYRDTEVQQYLKDHAVNFLVFKADILSKEAGNDPFKRAEMVKEMIETIAYVQDNIQRAFYIKECSTLFGISEESLNIELRKLLWKKFENNKEQPPVTLPYIPPVSQNEPAAKNKSTYNIEKNVVFLLLKYGMYEIDAEFVNDEKEHFYSKIRLDQYIFDNFAEDSISLGTPLFRKIFEQYVIVAETATDQIDIQRFFSNHEDTEIQNFAISLLSKEDPSYSIEWKNRFGVHINHIDNDAQILNKLLSNTIVAYKIQLLDNFLEVLNKELSYSHTEEEEDQIMDKYKQVLKKRGILASMNGTVVFK